MFVKNIANYSPFGASLRSSLSVSLSSNFGVRGLLCVTLALCGTLAEMF